MSRKSDWFLRRPYFLIFLVLILSFFLAACATTGPSVSREELKRKEEEFNRQFLAASEKWLPRVYRVAYQLVSSPVPGHGNETPRFGFVGVGVEELKDYARNAYGIPQSTKGVLVRGFYPGSRAEGLDLLPGDVLMKVGGKKTASLGSYFKTIRERAEGTVRAEIWRKGTILERDLPVEKVYYNAQFFLAPTPDFDASSLFSKIDVGIGAIRYCQNDDELAVIMGHELAHTTRRHSAKKMGVGIGTAMAYGGIAGVIDALTFPGIGNLVTGPIEQATNAAVSREYEREADYFGMMHGFHAGFDVENGAKVFSRLATDTPNFVVLAYALSTHPQWAERFLRLEKIVEEFRTKYPERFPLEKSPDWEISIEIKPGESLEEAVSRLVEPSPPVEIKAPALTINPKPVSAASAIRRTVKRVPSSAAPAPRLTEKAPVEVGAPSVGADEIETLKDLGREKRRLRLEQRRVAREMELFKQKQQLEEERRKLEGEKAKLEALRRAEEEAERLVREEKGRVERDRMEKFKIEAMGLSKDVDNLWLGASVGEVSERFRMADGKIVWFSKFKYGLRSLAASFKSPRFTATWFGPDGRIFQQETFTTAFGNTDLARNELKIDRSQPDVFVGKWRVVVRHKGEVLDEREFEIIE